jgi:hypothetical protein
MNINSIFNAKYQYNKQDVKSKNKFSDLTNANASSIKEKLQYNSTFNLVNPQSSKTLERKGSSSKLDNISYKADKSDKIYEKGAETARERNTYHKNNSSMPKLTNNIFYIINQNPQVNTQITIYGNIDNVKSGKTDKFSTKKVKETITSYVNNANKRMNYPRKFSDSITNNMRISASSLTSRGVSNYLINLDE